MFIQNVPVDTKYANVDIQSLVWIFKDFGVLKSWRNEETTNLRFLRQ